MNKKRRSQIKDAVIETLQACGKPLELPVPIKTIAKSFRNIRVIPYSIHMKRRKLSYEQMIVLAGTDDAYTDYDAKTGLYLIYYNDLGPNKIASNRYRWNIAHELGHVALEHHKKHKESRIFRNGISATLYRELEDEADMFAAYILVPHVIVSFVGADSDSQSIKRTCKISGQAAGIRFNEIWRWRQNSGAEEYDFTLLNLFADFVERECQIEPVKAWLSAHRTCRNCHTLIPYSQISHCSICGISYTSHYETEKHIMKYTGIELDEYSRAIECPVCHNTELIGNGTMCMICGNSLVNQCTEDFPPNRFPMCNDPLPGNARYCPHCGAKSSFFQRNILNAWNIPFDDDAGDLPF